MICESFQFVIFYLTKSLLETIPVGEKRTCLIGVDQGIFVYQLVGFSAEKVWLQQNQSLLKLRQASHHDYRQQIPSSPEVFHDFGNFQEELAFVL